MSAAVIQATVGTESKRCGVPRAGTFYGSGEMKISSRFWTNDVAARATIEIPGSQTERAAYADGPFCADRPSRADCSCRTITPVTLNMLGEPLALTTPFTPLAFDVPSVPTILFTSLVPLQCPARDVQRSDTLSHDTECH